MIKNSAAKITFLTIFEFKSLTIIVFAIIIALAGIWFVLDTYVLSNDGPEVVEEPVKTPEQLQQEKEAAEKAAFLGRLSGETTADINLITEILNYGKNNAKVSSILLYKQSLLFEVFGDTRDQVAMVNISLKNSSLQKRFKRN